MKVRDTLLMLLRASNNSISGKTKIHKECYLLSRKMKRIQQLFFKPYYYGPYSPSVDYTLSELVSIGFVNERKLPWDVDNRGFEKVLFEYTLTSEGERMADILKSRYNRKYGQIINFVKTLKDNLGDPSYIDLAAASKAYFILSKEGKTMTPYEIKQKAKDFNWSLTNINNAERILEELDLIQKK